MRFGEKDCLPCPFCNSYPPKIVVGKYQSYVVCGNGLCNSKGVTTEDPHLAVVGWNRRSGKEGPAVRDERFVPVTVSKEVVWLDLAELRMLRRDHQKDNGTYFTTVVFGDGSWERFLNESLPDDIVDRWKRVKESQ